MNTLISLAATAAVGLTVVAVPALLPDGEVAVGTEVTADTALNADAVGGELAVLSDLEISLGADAAGIVDHPRFDRPWYARLFTKFTTLLEVQ